jgi:hypothetical protein
MNWKYDSTNDTPRDPQVARGPIDDLPHPDYTTTREGQHRSIEVSFDSRNVEVSFASE